MRYEYSLTLRDKFRAAKEWELQDPMARWRFWCFVCSLPSPMVPVLGKYLDGEYVQRDVPIAMIVIACACMIRFVYATVRRLRMVNQRWGSFQPREYDVECQPDRLVLRRAEKSRSIRWDTVQLLETPRFLVFLLDDMTNACFLPKRVIPPEEQPKLKAFLAERIRPREQLPERPVLTEPGPETA